MKPFKVLLSKLGHVFLTFPYKAISYLNHHSVQTNRVNTYYFRLDFTSLYSLTESYKPTKQVL